MRKFLQTLFSFIFISNSFSQQSNFTSYSVQEGLSQSQVYSIYQDKRGFIWFGTGSGGVNVFDGTHFKNYTEKDGLAENYVKSIIQDSKGNMWFSTGVGVTK